MHVKLVVIDGDVKTSEIRLKMPAIVGRGRGASLQIPQALVSRQHCEFVALDGKLRVRDLGSLNGTLVDGKKVAEAEIVSGQTLTIGSVTFRVEYGESVRFTEASKLPAKSEGQHVAAPPPPAAVEPSVVPKTDQIFLDVGAEIAAHGAELAEPEQDEPLEFFAEEASGEEVAPEEPIAAFLPPAANSPATLTTPAALPPAANLPTQPAPLAIPVVAPVAGPMAAAPAAVPSPPTTPASASQPKSADDDDDDDLRAFLQSLGK